MKELKPVALDVLRRKGMGEEICSDDLQVFKNSLFKTIETTSPTTFELASIIAKAWDSIYNYMVMLAWIKSECLPDRAKRGVIHQLIFNEGALNDGGIKMRRKYLATQICKFKVVITIAIRKISI